MSIGSNNSIYVHICTCTIYNQFNKKGRRIHFLLFQSSSLENDKRKSILSSLILRIFSLIPSIIPTHMTCTCINVGLPILRLLKSLFLYEIVQCTSDVDRRDFKCVLFASFHLRVFIPKYIETFVVVKFRIKKCDQTKKNLFCCTKILQFYKKNFSRIWLQFKVKSSYIDNWIRMLSLIIRVSGC